MELTRRKAILYGDSLILQGVQAELAGLADLEVIVVAPPLNIPLEELCALHPSVIIFDLGARQPDFPQAWFQEPGLLLIGMDPANHQALVWSGKQVAAVGTANLIQMIRPEVDGEP